MRDRDRETKQAECPPQVVGLGKPDNQVDFLQFQNARLREEIQEMKSELLELYRRVSRNF
jgi:hypothetical protein